MLGSIVSMQSNEAASYLILTSNPLYKLSASCCELPILVILDIMASYRIYIRT
jgi:hypothetical protein